MKRNLILFTLLLVFLCTTHLIGNDNTTSIPKEQNKIVVPFKAQVYNVNVITKPLSSQTKSHTYKLTDYLKHKKNGVIKTGIDSHWRISALITELFCESNLLSVGDSLDFIIHSPSKLFIDVESLPTEYSFELHADLTDSLAVTFELWPLFSK